MKRLNYLCLLLVLSLFACQKADTNLLLEANKEMSIGPAGKVTICHDSGNGKVLVIEVNQNALAAHLAHGDSVPDSDGDGYTAVGACTGSADDCNDNDASINPGAVDICGDGTDNNCNGLVDENCGPDFKTFHIRNTNGSIFGPWDADIILSENAAGDGFTFATPHGGQKVGYGTEFFNGVRINTLESVNWNWLSVPANNGIIPYLNIWVTDANNFALISSENNYRGTNFGTRREWKIFEYGPSKTDFSWLFDGRPASRDAAQYLVLNGQRITLSDISNRILINDPRWYPSGNVGSGAPRGGYGLNLIWGDTQNNFVVPNGLQIGGLTVKVAGVNHAAMN